MTRNASLGDRIKRYERVFDHRLTPRSCLFIRVDGRAFHTYTRGCVRPFDPDIIHAMAEATRRTAEDMQGFRLAYTQSDEATFMLADFDDLQTQGWFDYSLNKVVSLSASLFTAWFSRFHNNGRVATFDSRAFTVPVEDAPNVFIWRQRDWERNSLQMLAHSHFSHKALHLKGFSDIHEMLHEKNVNWADLPPYLKNGTFLLRDGSVVTDKASYADVRGMARLDAEEVEVT